MSAAALRIGDVSLGGAAAAVVAISTSAGGLDPLRRLVRGLRPDFPAAVVIAQHVLAVSVLPEILAYDTRMPVAFVQPGCTLRPSTIHVCPAQQHVFVNPDRTVALSGRERLKFFRPSGDWLFASVAESFGEHAYAVVLSGLQNDGALGAVIVRAAGGTVIAQDPVTCERAAMPSAAIATGAVNFVLAPEQIAEVLMRLLMPAN